MIAGSMAERVAGKSWEDLMQENLFQPLGMSSAGFGAPGSSGQVDQPWGHFKSDGDWVPVQTDNPEAIGPAGTVHSSFEDWAKFISLQLPMKETQILDRDALDFLASPIGDYAAGWGVVQRDWANGATLNHSGSNNRWFTIAWIAPEINRAFVVGTNSADGKSANILDRIIGQLIDYDRQQ